LNEVHVFYKTKIIIARQVHNLANFS